MISTRNQSNNMKAYNVDNNAMQAAWENAAFFNKSAYRRASILGIASSSLFSNTELLGLMQWSLQQESSMARVSPADMVSEVLEEISSSSSDYGGDDIFGNADDDLADFLAFEPRPLGDTSRMNIVDSIPPLNLYNSMNTQYLSLFKETLFNNNNNTEEPRLRLSHPAVTSMIWVSDESTSDSRKRKHQLGCVVQQSISKRQREQQDEEVLVARRFRPYQAEQWTVKFAELLEFKEQKGHCCVPHTFEKNPALARWVKRQRYQYKLKIDGNISTMTHERIQALEEHGFIWDSHGAAWQERWNELAEYQGLHGHCNVPSSYASNPPLATWVKSQRRQYKLYFEAKPNTNTTPERIAELESLGFEWELRRSSNYINRSQK
jgi:hypothetical protein